MKITRLAAALATFCCATTVHAQASKPGQYDYAVKVTVMGMGMPAMNFKHCVTQKDIDEGKAYVNKEGMKSCTYSDMKRTGDKIAFRVSCTDPKMTGNANGTIAAENFTIDMLTVVSEPMRMETRSVVTAQRIGDC